MLTKPCPVCGKPHDSRSEMCRPCRNNQRQVLADRFWGNVEKTKTCWLWKKSRNHAGYGKVQIGTLKKPKMEYAHRVSMSLKGIDLMHTEGHHACPNKHCVRIHPKHVQVVPRQHNPDSPSHLNRMKTSCMRGHEFEMILVGNKIRRRCPTCVKARYVTNASRVGKKIAKQDF